MIKIVKVNLPINISHADRYLFEPFLSYKLPSLKVRIKKNVFVTYSGLCIKNGTLLKESHHSNPIQYKDFLNDAAYYYYNALEYPSNLISLHDNNTYLSIHHPWFNYYHWICECIFRLWNVKESVSEYILILPHYYKYCDFIMGALEPFSFKDIFFIPEGKSIHVKQICIPQIKPVVDSYDSNLLLQVGQFYTKYVDSKGIDISLGDRVYISRKKASRKKVENEDELEMILKKYDFKVINNEDFTFLQQVSIYSKVRYLISIHGSGLTNMLFMPSNASIFELYKRQTNDGDWHSHAFWYMADALGHRYYYQLCQPTDVNDDYFTANLLVNPQTFEATIEKMLHTT